MKLSNAAGLRGCLVLAENMLHVNSLEKHCIFLPQKLSAFPTTTISLSITLVVQLLSTLELSVNVVAWTLLWARPSV